MLKQIFAHSPSQSSKNIELLTGNQSILIVRNRLKSYLLGCNFIPTDKSGHSKEIRIEILELEFDKIATLLYNPKIQNSSVLYQEKSRNEFLFMLELGFSISL